MTHECVRQPQCVVCVILTARGMDPSSLGGAPQNLQQYRTTGFCIPVAILFELLTLAHLILPFETPSLCHVGYHSK